MDDALLATVLLGAVGTALVLLVLWWWTAADREREEETQRIAGHDLHKWADRRGWRSCDAPPRTLSDPWAHEIAAGDQLVRAAEGAHAGRAAAIALYLRHNDDGTHRFLACLVELPAPQPAVRIARRWGIPIRPRNPALSDRDSEFDRKMKVEMFSDTDADRLFVAPVRAALLRLSALAPDGTEFVRMNGRTLRVVLPGWPPAVDLDRLLDEATGLAESLAPGDRSR